jgi:prevent-host-death family protein
MSTYSVADAKAGLPSLINRALAGEEVIITRHGKPVVELRPASVPNPAGRAAALKRLLAHSITPAAGAPTSVELMNLIYDAPDE